MSYSKKKHISKKKKLSRKRRLICEAFLSKKNLTRDIIIISITVGILILSIFNHLRLLLKSNQESLPQQSTAKNIVENQEIEIPSVDTTSWQDYQNPWYGFKLRYPDDWTKSIFQKTDKNSKWEYQYQFRKKEVAENDSYVGFNVIVYNTIKIKEIKDTEEFPALKNQELTENDSCNKIEKYFKENENYLAKELQILPNDSCYNKAYFFSLARDEYIFNIVPILKENQETPTNSRGDVISNFPEFFSVVSSLNLSDIKKSALISVKPRITAPKPIAEVEKDELGRSVCKLKNDHPSKSHKGKGKHLDMECCLDPDEYPNPHCYYSESKYGKYL